MTTLESEAQAALGADKAAKNAGRPGLRLGDGRLIRLSYQEANALGVVAGVSVISVD